MISFLKRSLPTVIFVIFISLLTAYVLLDAFVIERPATDGPITLPPGLTTGKPITPMPPEDSNGADTTADTDSGNTPDSDKEPDVTYPIIGDLYYKDENIEITITEHDLMNQNGIDTAYFVVDLKLSDIEYLRTAFAKEQYGYKIRETTTEIAERYNAIFAINGDYYGYRKDGFVLRNYTLWRDEPRSRKDGDDALGILPDGSLFMFDENYMDSSNLLLADVYQVFSFGPRLIENGDILVDERSEVNQSAASNPRTGIGMVSPLHYKIVVSEGRLVNGDGLTLLELAEIFDDLGCDTAYNLDGGSSTTLYFNGKVLNALPGDEREISDIIFINGLTYSEDPRAQ